MHTVKQDPPVYNLMIAQVLALVAGFTVTQLNFSAVSDKNERVYTVELETPSLPVRRFAVQILEDVTFSWHVPRLLRRGHRDTSRSKRQATVARPSEKRGVAHV